MANKKISRKKQGRSEKKRKKRTVAPKVLVNIKATYNNTIASVSDYDGNVIAISSCGALGFSGSRKSTVYAATKVGEDIANKALAAGAKEAEVFIKGVGVGRQATVKGLRAGGLRISVLLDKTPVPHGGVKPRKAPRK
jgi:small subunit ribosomal protein S11